MHSILRPHRHSPVRNRGINERIAIACQSFPNKHEWLRDNGKYYFCKDQFPHRRVNEEPLTYLYKLCPYFQPYARASLYETELALSQYDLLYETQTILHYQLLETPALDYLVEQIRNFLLIESKHHNGHLPLGNLIFLPFRSIQLPHPFCDK